MTAHLYLPFAAMALVAVLGAAAAFADDEVMIYGESPSHSSSVKPSSTSSSSTVASTTTSSSSTTSTHHHHHHASSSTATASTATSTASHSSHKKKPSQTAAAEASSGVTPPVIVISSSNPGESSATPTEPMTVSAPMPTLVRSATGAGPVVETGLPVAKPGSSTPVYGMSFPHTRSYQMASAFPLSNASDLGTSHVKESDNFSFTDFARKPHNIYPWKYNIITTEFWIGEGGSNISPTDNVASAWDSNWRSDNHGTDSPNDRDGYAPADHAAMINPFYIALPFNDLAFPDKARRWLPSGWYRPSRDGKQVSACKDRWVEIKNEQGDTCYAQWEDVGPLRYDYAEYVFGNARPDTYTRAGLDVSPAVAQYLNINGRNRITRWRFVDDADVQPGMWLKYDEEALLLNAIKNSPSQPLPMRSARAPIIDQGDIDSNQKQINKAKG